MRAPCDTEGSISLFGVPCGSSWGSSMKTVAAAVLRGGGWNNEYGPPPKAGFNGRTVNTPSSSSSGGETETLLSSYGGEIGTLLSLPAVKFSSVFCTVSGDGISVIFGEEKILSTCYHGSTKLSSMSTRHTPN